LKNSQSSPRTGGFGLATIKEQIEMIRAEIDKTQKNKATNAHIGKLKAKIAQLKLKEEKTAAHSKASGGGKGFEVKKSGDATVALVGFPSVGKSTLISKVTDAHSETGGYAFTTLTCIPGVMEHRGAKIQILDLPGLIKGAAEGKGRGREILNVIRSADMVLYIVDPFQDGHFNVLHRELHNAGLRLNEVKPPVFINRTDRGGIEIRSTVEQTHLEEEEIADIIRTFGYTSALVTLREDSTAEQIVDALAGNRVYEKAVIAINKIDIATEQDIARARSALPEDWPVMNISAFKDIGLDELKDFIYENLGFMRIYLKPQGQEADMEEPLIVKDDSTVENICVKLHRDFVRKFRFARVRGPSAKFDDQRVGLDHQLMDGDVLTIIVKR
jgi:small GTP-binding protein